MRYFYLFTFVAIGIFAHGQSDTTWLKEVTVVSFPVTRYSIGSRVEKISLSDDVTTLSKSLEDLSSVYLKTYGNSQLSSLSLRGTTTSQTAILWNGININSPTLGQTDLSLIPMFLFDEVALQYGTSSALYGSDALGGTLMLSSSSPNFSKTFKVKAVQQTGSFGHRSTGLKILIGSSRFESRSKAYHSFVRNNFSYNAPAVGHEKEQQHASVTNYGVDQELHYKFSEHSTLSAEGMYTYNFRQIQPVVTNTAGDETLEDKHIRASLSYKAELSFASMQATAAFVKSDQDFFNDLTSNVNSTQYASLLAFDQPLNDRSNLRYGASYNSYRASSEAYNNATDSRLEFFSSYRRALTQKLLANINVRQLIDSEDHVAFAPTLGVEWNPDLSASQKMTFRFQGGRGYRVPTLNDRFWEPGGNPQLKPESGNQIEAGVDWKWRKNDIRKLELSATFFKSWMKEMIVWTPVNQVWTPLNLQSVEIMGVETSIKSEARSASFTIRPSVSYSLTRSINQKPLAQNDHSTEGKQLPYVPVHQLRASVPLLYKGWTLSTEYSFTGERFTSLSNASYQKLEHYNLLNLSCSKNFIVKDRFGITIKADVNNVTDIYYENVQNNAMPGRNYLITLIINN